VHTWASGTPFRPASTLSHCGEGHPRDLHRSGLVRLRGVGNPSKVSRNTGLDSAENARTAESRGSHTKSRRPAWH
jgi:hypothetical protein